MTGGRGGGLSWRDVTFVIKIHCRGDSVFNCYNCYCAGAATLGPFINYVTQKGGGGGGLNNCDGL